MNVCVEMQNGEKKEFRECERIEYHEGFIEIHDTYYHSEVFPASDIKKITKESRRSW